VTRRRRDVGLTVLTLMAALVFASCSGDKEGGPDAEQDAAAGGKVRTAPRRDRTIKPPYSAELKLCLAEIKADRYTPDHVTWIQRQKGIDRALRYEIRHVWQGEPAYASTLVLLSAMRKDPGNLSPWPEFFREVAREAMRADWSALGDRKMAAEFLSSCLRSVGEGAEGRKVLIEAVRSHPSGYVRSWAVLRLCHYKDQRDAELFVKAADDPDETTRVQALKALASLGATAGKAPARRLLADEGQPPAVRNYAAALLVVLDCADSREDIGKQARRVVERMAKQLRDRSPEGLKQARATGLGLAVLVRAFIGAADPAVWQPALERIAAAPEAEIRRTLAEALAKELLLPKVLRPLVERLTKDEDPTVRRHATEARDRLPG